MPQKLLYSECKYGRLVAGQQPFEAVCPCCLTTMLIEACCQVDCGINADIYPLQTANNQKKQANLSNLWYNGIRKKQKRCGKNELRKNNI